MKIILSKKGFDTRFGGNPSPIFPDGSMVSLPIEDKDSGIGYASLLSHNDYNIGKLAADLTNSPQFLTEQTAHLDPDLFHGTKTRKTGWRPAFGQGGAAYGHLKNQDIGSGDLFLFYGLFRHIWKNEKDVFVYEQQAKPKHVIWGWLQVDEVKRVWDLKNDSAYEWLSEHPHLRGERIEKDKAHAVYIAKEHLILSGLDTPWPGAGIFPTLQPQLELSDKEAPSFRIWSLPAFFNPSQGKTPLTYHSTAEWRPKGATVSVKRRGGYGQEFVLNGNEYEPDITNWLKKLFIK